VRVGVSVDMEGVSELRNPHEILAFARPYWDSGRARITADAAAAARGLLAAGADEVVVLDNHGSGNPENIIGSELPAGARLETWNIFDLRANGVEALLQVGYHARAGIPAFISHTYVPGLRLRVDGELIGESHGRAWAAGVPLLGITGNEVHERRLGSLAGVPYLAVQRTTSTVDAAPAFADAAEAIADFAARSLRSRGAIAEPPTDFLFEASFPAGVEPEGWERTSETEWAVELATWTDARAPLAAAMAAAIAPWLPYFTTHDLTSRESLEAIYDEPVLVEGRARFDEWLGAPQAEWLTPAG
jgi:D-amino peptidase